jgi:hypothetical protein
VTNHSGRRHVENAAEQVRREPQGDKGKRNESQKREQLDAEEIDARKYVPDGRSLILNRVSASVVRRIQHLDAPITARCV